MPFDEKPPTETSGIRLGTPAGTTRGFGEAEFAEIGNLIADVLDSVDGGDITSVTASVKKQVEALCQRFPIYESQ